MRMDELKEMLEVKPDLTKTDKILLLIQTMSQEMPLPVQMIIKTNVGLAKAYLSNVEEDKLNECLDDLISIIQNIRG